MILSLLSLLVSPSLSPLTSDASEYRLYTPRRAPSNVVDLHHCATPLRIVLLRPRHHCAPLPRCLSLHRFIDQILRHPSCADTSVVVTPLRTRTRSIIAFTYTSLPARRICLPHVVLPCSLYRWIL
ncbi:hypothetical protein U1Q18_011248 [Sarracenia purpurea var. burkii]